MAFCESLECWQLTDGSSKVCKDHAHNTHRLDLSGLGSVHLQHHAAPAHDFSKAVALTQTAINNLGGPIHASMIDHKPVDVALAQALTQNAITHQGERHVDSEKLPHDRAIAEALTLNAIAHQPQDKLKQTGRRSSLDVGLTAEQQGALLEEAKAEKDRKSASRVFGGGDPKEAMTNILDEINHQGIIAVPHHKVPDENITLNQIKTLAQINAGDAASKLRHTEAPVDHSIAQAQTLKALSSDAAKAHLTHTETSPVDLSLAHGKVVYAIDHMKEPHLKHDETISAKRRGSDPALTHGQTLYAIEHREHGTPSDKVFPDKALAEALTMTALGSEAPKSHLHHVDHPHEGLTKEEIAALQAAAQQEKAQDPQESESEKAPVFHLPKTSE